MGKYINKGAFMLSVDNMIVVDENNIEELVQDPVIRERMHAQLEVKPVKPGEVLIKVEAVGVCGSDVHYFHDGRCGTFVVEKDRDIPYMLGHECSGTVVEVGEGVTHLKVGDRVCCEPSVTCGECDYCKSGHYNLCENVVFWATPPIQGCYMKYVPFKASLCFKMPEGMNAVQGALIEPMAIGMYAAETGGVTVGDTVVISGCGCIGLMTLISCKARGASRIIMSDINRIRLDKALELGADEVIRDTDGDVVARIMELTGGEGADIVFEASGNPGALLNTSRIAKKGGLIVLIGMTANEEAVFNFGQVMAKELTIKSIFRYVNMFPKSVAAVATGLAPVEKVATDIYPLEQIQKAFEDSVYRKDEVVKAVVTFD